MKNYYSPDALLTEKIKSFAPFAELIPGIVVIHETQNFSLMFMSAKGMKLLGITPKDIKNSESRYHLSFFDNNDAEPFFHKKIRNQEKNRNLFLLFNK